MLNCLSLLYYIATLCISFSDDLDIAPDFFEYFLATHAILVGDPTLWCVSAWNDNGKDSLVAYEPGKDVKLCTTSSKHLVKALDFEIKIICAYFLMLFLICFLFYFELFYWIIVSLMHVSFLSRIIV